MFFGLLLVAICHSLAWLKGHGRHLWGWDFSIWTYWATFGLVTNFLGLTGWWRVCDCLDGNYWLATVICITTGFTMTILLNTIAYGANWRAAGALVLVGLAGMLVR